ncbi:MAG: site-specific DNA-methyltransferase [Proteobacteria bacterium]|nr:site-specific DNA-methyltransferase [Pseudomonadota bacterium]
MFAPTDNCVLYNENCLETLNRGLQYHYVITSPPDFDEIGENPDESKKKWENLMYETFSKLNPINNVVTIVLRDRKSGGKIVKKHTFITNTMEELGWIHKSQKIWVRSKNANLYRFNYSFVLTFKRPGKQFSREGFSELSIPDVIEHEVKPYKTYVDNYPIGLLNDFIDVYTNPGDLIFDPFMGSGSTAEACIYANRNWAGSEIVPEIYELATNRLSTIYDERDKGYVGLNFG